MTTRFIVTLTLLPRSATEPTSPRYACTFFLSDLGVIYHENKQPHLEKTTNALLLHWETEADCTKLLTKLQNE